jgi:CRISPR-associated protein Csd1
MGWIQKLYETYEWCAGHEPPGSSPLMPLGHTPQQAHIEIVIDGNGRFRRASVLPKGTTAIIPATEDSASRSSGEAPHPLCDKIQYCAGDYQKYGGEKAIYFDTEHPSVWRDMLTS